MPGHQYSSDLMFKKIIKTVYFQKLNKYFNILFHSSVILNKNDDNLGKYTVYNNSFLTSSSKECLSITIISVSPSSSNT